MNSMKLKSRKGKLSTKSIVIISIIFSFVVIGIGYAYIQSSLSINGNSTISGGIWGVRFEGLAISSNSTASTSSVSIADDGSSISLYTKFSSVEEIFEAEVNLVNYGSTDAMVSDLEIIDFPDEYKPYVNYEILYAKDNTPVKSCDILPGNNEEEWLKIRFSVNQDADLSNLPTDGSGKITINIPYVQAGSCAPKPEKPEGPGGEEEAE